MRAALPPLTAAPAGVLAAVRRSDAQSRWKQALGRTVPLRMVREADGFDVHVVALEEDEDRR
jgi:hypothetical protein